MPGQSELTRTPNGARSFAAHCAKLISPAFEALYGGSVCEPIWPATEAMNRIVPVLASAIAGAKAWATFTAPIRLTRSTRSQSAGSRFQNGNPNFPEPTPAAWTTWSHRPNRRRIALGQPGHRHRVGDVGHEPLGTSADRLRDDRDGGVAVDQQRDGPLGRERRRDRRAEPVRPSRRPRRRYLSVPDPR